MSSACTLVLGTLLLAYCGPCWSAVGLYLPVLARIALLIVLFGTATFAAAHPAPFSYLDVHLDDDGVHGTLVIHDFDAAHELGIDKAALLSDLPVARSHRATLIALVEARLRLRVDEAPVKFVWGEIDVLPERQSLLLPFSLARPARSALDIETL